MAANAGTPLRSPCMNRRKFLVSSLASSALYGAHRETVAALGAALSAPSQDALPAGDALPADLRQKLQHDPLRPQFHLLPKANWMNDPCAPRLHRGEYHMFFQYNPDAAVWGDMHWAHAASPDLIHWKHLPVALAPTPGSFDSFGIFTGSALPGMPVATVLYTGVSKTSPEFETIRGEGTREVQCLATSADPHLKTWSKLDKPVLDGPPPGLKVTGFRDPCPWKDGDTWYLIVGSGFDKVGGAVLLYRSSDGREWEYLHPLAQGKWNGGTQTNPVDTGEMWECPDFFPLGGKHVLLYSTERKVYWEVGTFDQRELKFHTETRGLLDHGSYYAMKSMVDAKGRRILWGWVQETRPNADLKAAGWAGAMALPRVLTLAPDNTLHMELPPEFATLRQNTRTIDRSPTLEAIGAALARAPIGNRAAAITCNFKPATDAFALELRTEGVSTPLIAIAYDGSKDKQTLNVAGKPLQLTPASSGISTLELWMDGSIFEALVDNREAMTARCYAPSTGYIHLSWIGSPAALQSMSISAVVPISGDRLTS